MKRVETELSRRVNAVMTMRQLRQCDVVAKGFKQNNLSEIQNGRRATIDVKNLFKLSDILECDPRWLALGEGTPDKK